MPVNARLHIVTSLKGERTIAEKVFYSQPFKLLPLPSPEPGTLRLMLMSASPGVMDGDQYNTRIEIGEGAALSIETPAYQRVFQMIHGARQNTKVYLATGSTLTYLPKPVVPQQGSIMEATNKIFLSPGSSLAWGEVLTCGRKLNGEVFSFTRFHSITELYWKEKLVLRENLLLEPSKMQLAGIGHWEGFTHQATLICFNDKSGFEHVVDELRALIGDEADVEGGCTIWHPHGLLVRLLGHKAEQLMDILHTISGLASSTMNNNSAPNIKQYAC